MIGANSWLIEAAKTTSARAYDRLKRAIIHGEFRPGERLTESAVAARFGVSRTPVREAFARLAKDGLVRNGMAGGIEVVDPWVEFLDIYHVREVIEGCAARLAAMRATTQEAAAIADLARASRRTDPTDVKARAKINEAFHLKIAAAARAPRLQRLVGDYRELFASPRILKLYTPNDTKQALDDHERIATAIAVRDGDAAEAAMRDHLRTAYARGLKMHLPLSAMDETRSDAVERLAAGNSPHHRRKVGP